MTGPNPVDRGKPGSKLHVLTDRGGLPLATAFPRPHHPDGFAVKPLVGAIPIGPAADLAAASPAAHGDKAYNGAERRVWLQHGNCAPPGSHRHRDQPETGRHRWVVERSIAWLAVTDA